MTDIQLKYLQHQENIRHNLAGEQLTTEKQAEEARANRAKEDAARATIEETVRKNLVAEGYTREQIDEAFKQNKWDRFFKGVHAINESTQTINQVAKDAFSVVKGIIGMMGA